MADFRAVAVNLLKWFPQSRKTVPVTPVRVQVPPSACVISLLPGRYSIDLTLAGHAAHPQFVEFVRDVERHAQAHARPAVHGLQWYSCVDGDSLIPCMRLAAFDDTRFYDASGLEHVHPTSMKACSCLVELVGAWTTDALWGVRWKVLEVKERPDAVPVPCLLD